MSQGLTKLEPSFRERIWGITGLSPWFPDSQTKIGEAWFPGDSLLVKFLFTAENLSVQVHPHDDFAQQFEGSRGKTEMWHILEAKPGAAVALGFRESISPAHFKEALAQNRVEEILHWAPAKPGDTFFVPAGVVHAIGAGLTICEIQQHSDVTYRLYDYGRPRELHLDRGMAVSQFAPYDGRVQLPFSCEYFKTSLVQLDQAQVMNAGPGRERMWIVLEGQGSLNGQEYRKGDAWRLDDDCPPVQAEPATTTRILVSGV